LHKADGLGSELNRPFYTDELTVWLRDDGGSMEPAVKLDDVEGGRVASITLPPDGVAGFKAWLDCVSEARAA